MNKLFLLIIFVMCVIRSSIIYECMVIDLAFCYVTFSILCLAALSEYICTNSGTHFCCCENAAVVTVPASHKGGGFQSAVCLEPNPNSSI